MRKKKTPEGFFSVDGLNVTLEESRALPIVDFELLFLTGGVQDPVGLEGLTRTTFLTMRRGTRGMKGPAVEEAIARLGARLGVDISTSYVRVHGSVIKRNLEPFFALVASLLEKPAFRKADLAQVVRETRAELARIRDHDRALAGRWFRRTLYRSHAYGRSIAGSPESLSRLRARDLRECYASHVVADNLLVGFSGDVDREEATRLVETHLAFLPSGPAPRDALPTPRRKAGRRVVVVDKPSRSQTQLCIGTLGIAAGDPRYYPLEVANTAFGGTFSSPLVQEVREKRGWSYGVYSRIGLDRQRDTFTMWSHPASADAASCVALELDLLERFVDDGLRKKDFTFAKRYLVNSRCFEVDTAQKRLEPRLDVVLFGLPHGYWDDFEDNVRKVQLDAARAAVRDVISSPRPRHQHHRHRVRGGPRPRKAPRDPLRSGDPLRHRLNGALLGQELGERGEEPRGADGLAEDRIEEIVAEHLRVAPGDHDDPRRRVAHRVAHLAREDLAVHPGHVEVDQGGHQVPLAAKHERLFGVVSHLDLEPRGSEEPSDRARIGVVVVQDQKASHRKCRRELADAPGPIERRQLVHARFAREAMEGPPRRQRRSLLELLLAAAPEQHRRVLGQGRGERRDGLGAKHPLALIDDQRRLFPTSQR